MAYAMERLKWKFYFINAAWDFVFLVIAYFTFVETKGLNLEDINAKFEGIEGIPADRDSDNDSSIQKAGEADSKLGGVVSKTQAL
jgi:hypothetical protein